jgi:hypothetical protein
VEEDNTREEDTAVAGDTHQAALVEAAEPDQALRDKHIQGVEGPDNDGGKYHAEAATFAEEDMVALLLGLDTALDHGRALVEEGTGCGHLLLEASGEIVLRSRRLGSDHPAEGIAAVERLAGRPSAPCREVVVGDTGLREG